MLPADLSLIDLSENMANKMPELKKNSNHPMESMLFAQAHALQAIFEKAAIAKRLNHK
jgi:hypothetical protein